MKPQVANFDIVGKYVIHLLDPALRLKPVVAFSINPSDSLSFRCAHMTFMMFMYPLQTLWWADLITAATATKTEALRCWITGVPAPDTTDLTDYGPTDKTDTVTGFGIKCRNNYVFLVTFFLFCRSSIPFYV